MARLSRLVQQEGETGPGTRTGAGALKGVMLVLQENVELRINLISADGSGAVLY